MMENWSSGRKGRNLKRSIQLVSLHHDRLAGPFDESSPAPNKLRTDERWVKMYQKLILKLAHKLYIYF